LAPEKIVVVVQTENLPAGTTLTALMREDGQEFPWFNPETALAQPDPLSGAAQIVLDRRCQRANPASGCDLYGHCHCFGSKR
jgi:hypothetical protein